MGFSGMAWKKNVLMWLILLAALTPAAAQELHQLSVLQLARRCQEAAKEGDFITMEECVRRLVKMAPDLPQSFLGQSLICMYQDDYAKALDNCKRAEQLDPQNADVIACRGKVLLEFGFLDCAAEIVRPALAIDPKNDPALSVCVDVLYHRKQYEAALDASAAAIKMVPLSKDLHEKHVKALLRLKRYDIALEEVNQMIAHQPKHATHYLLRAKIQGLRGDLAQSLADTARALELSPNHLEVIANSAWLYATNPVAGFCDGKKAVQLATRACEIVKWKNHELLGGLAAAEAEAGLYDEAIQHQQEVVDWYLTNFPQHFRLPSAKKQLSLFKQRKPYRDLEEAD